MKLASANIVFSVNVRRLPLARLGDTVRELASAGIGELKVDVCDGTFAPGFALGFEIIEALRESTNLPIHAHLMAERPERYIADFARLGCAGLTMPIEACTHAYRTFTQIREAGLKANVSINPGTALTKLEYVLPLVARVLVPVRDSNHGDEELPRAAFERVRILRENIEYHKTDASIAVEGGLSAVDAARLAASGADCVVLDRADVLRAGALSQTVRAFTEDVATARKTA